MESHAHMIEGSNLTETDRGSRKLTTREGKEYMSNSKEENGVTPETRISISER